MASFGRQHAAVAALALALAALWPAQPALASGDSACTSGASMEHGDYDGCANRAMLTPGNDTRANLWLLQADRQGYAPFATPVKLEYDGDPAAAGLFTWEGLVAQWQASVGGASGEASGSDPGYGRCVSSESGMAAFLKAIGAAGDLRADERTRLQADREAVAEACGTDGYSPAMAKALRAAMTTDAGRAYARYVEAAALFYGDAPALSRPLYAELTEQRDPWLREAARYMLARVDLNVAQVDAWGEYGEFVPAKVDHAALTAAERGFQDYLKAYPQGKYAASARGLLRRVHWLSGDAAAMLRTYAGALQAVTSPSASKALIQEIDTMVLRPSTAAEPKAMPAQDPVLLAVDDLWRMRSWSGDGPSPWQLTAAALEAQKPVFATQPALFDFLRATHAYYVQRDPALALRHLGEHATRGGSSNLDFSIRVLRAMAAEATKAADARTRIVGLFPQTVPVQRSLLEVLLAGYDERSGALDKVYATDSLITDPAIRDVLLQQVAGDALLARQVQDAKATRHERDMALYVLLYRTLTRARYGDFLRWQAQVPADAKRPADRWSMLVPDADIAVFRWAGAREGFVCPALTAVADTLAKKPNDARASLCLGDFLRTQGFDNFVLDHGLAGERTTRERQKELASTPLLFPGTSLTRAAIYQRVMDDPAASRDDRAYALYRAVSCYAPAGMSDCGGDEVDKAQRRRWFNRLKSEFKDTSWARKLQYYW